MSFLQVSEDRSLSLQKMSVGLPVKVGEFWNQPLVALEEIVRAGSDLGNLEVTVNWRRDNPNFAHGMSQVREVFSREGLQVDSDWGAENQFIVRSDQFVEGIFTPGEQAWHAVSFSRQAYINLNHSELNQSIAERLYVQAMTLKAQELMAQRDVEQWEQAGSDPDESESEIPGYSLLSDKIKQEIWTAIQHELAQIADCEDESFTPVGSREFSREMPAATGPELFELGKPQSPDGGEESPGIASGRIELDRIQVV